MKITLLALILAWLALPLAAQTNQTVRLALIAESDDASPALDVLTAELSSHTNIQLLERNEINKVYQEQSLSAGNTDFIKLGQILGADGLLLINTAKEGTNESLNIRLIAVKPGVVLIAEKFTKPDNLTEWSPVFARQLDPFFPKLTVALNDAIPISVVNLRSAIASAEESETEKELKLLAIQRLSQEQQLFVLERQRMDLLGVEKDLKQDELPFWNGSYLLDATVDQNGYSKDTITIDARLIPPHGGAPVALSISGSRTNLPEAINELAGKVIAELKIQSSLPRWNAADEAAKYFEEAKWAMRWGNVVEAQNDVDSAWALGKQDLECAELRITAYLTELSIETPVFQHAAYSLSSGFDYDGKPLGPPPSDAKVRQAINELSKTYPIGRVNRVTQAPGTRDVDYIFLNRKPAPDNINKAIHALELYYDFSRNAPGGGAKMFFLDPKQDHLHYADWYLLGINDLTQASQVLQDFNFFPEFQQDVGDNLGNLRTLERRVAELIEKLPIVHGSYFTEDRPVTGDELYHTSGEGLDFFACKVKWGCFWQERPEDTLEMYRVMMNRPEFSYIHTDFWLRDASIPRLAAWNQEDRQHIPKLWNDFCQELKTSTNVLWQLEAGALNLADAADEEKADIAFTNFFEIFLTNVEAMAANPINIISSDWGVEKLVHGNSDDLVRSSTQESMEKLYYGVYRPKIEALKSEYWNKIYPAQQMEIVFEQQKKYLAQNTSFEFFQFTGLFRQRDYTLDQARQIRPLISSYQSNLMAQAQEAIGIQKEILKSAIFSTGDVAKDVDKILTPPAPKPVVIAPASTNPTPVAAKASSAISPQRIIASTAAIKSAIAVPEPVSAAGNVTNVMLVDKFLPIPLDDIKQSIGAYAINNSRVRITAHHWIENKLILNFNYEFFGNGEWYGKAIAILDPATERWEVINCPADNDATLKNFYYHHTTLWQGDLVDSDDRQIKRYNRSSFQWENLPVSEGDNFELFTVNEHLYAANQNIIFEILDGGKSTHILASTRRQPQISALDQGFGLPTLFEGPGHSLCVYTGNKIYTWSGNDWQENPATIVSSMPPEILPDGILFRQAADRSNHPISVIFLAKETNVAELCFWQKEQNPGTIMNQWPRPNLAEDRNPTWKMPLDLNMAYLPTARSDSDMFFLVDHSEVHDVVDESRHEILKRKVTPKDGYNAVLMCFTHNVSQPAKIYLKFNVDEGYPPITGKAPVWLHNFSVLPSGWMLPISNVLICGMEDDPIADAGNSVDTLGYECGIWEIPTSKIQSAINEQNQKQTVETAKVSMAADSIRQNLLAKYGTNHNGVLDPDEKEQALLDPAFIESELDVIDANHNGRLDPEELAYFDANHNKVLEPNEQAGIEIAQRELATNLLQKFDVKGDGLLDRQEFSKLMQTMADRFTFSHLGIRGLVDYPDTNHDGYIDVAELEMFFQQKLLENLSGPSTSRPVMMMPLTSPSQHIDLKKVFERRVEAYWKRSQPSNAMTTNIIH